MKKALLLLLFVFQSILGVSQTFETFMLRDNGPSDKRINMVIMGDGYDATEQDQFVTDATNLINYLFTIPPYSNYEAYFNVYAIKVISPESGVKHPGTATDVQEPVFPVSDPDNYMGTTFDFQNIHRCIYTPNTNITTAILAANVPFFDSAFVVVNSPEYGGCAGQYAYFSAHSSANEILVHELGHSFSGLADEYWFAPTGESPNKTQDNNTGTNRWRNWLNTNGVGIYPFSEDTSWFRPHQSCIMRFLGQPFCSVCSETTIEKVHSLQGPVDFYTPTETTIILETGSVDFEVTLILPDPNTLDFEWRLNDVLIDDENQLVTIDIEDLETGANTLNFTVTDNTTLVRTDNHEVVHFDVVSWQINNGPLGIEDISVFESSFVIYPNPSANIVYIKSNSSDARTLTFELVDITGKIIKTEKLSKDTYNVYAFEMGNLASQTYILNLYNENNGLIYSHKIVKE